MITRGSRTALAGLLFVACGFGTGLRAQDKSAAPPALDPELRAAVDAHLARPLDPREGAVELWRRTVLRHGDVDELLADLEKRTADEDKSNDDAVRRFRARLLRIRGDLDSALKTLEKIAEDQRTPADRLARAEVLDAKGQVKDAIAAYEAMLTGEAKLEGDLEKTLRLRIALMRTEKKDGASALATFAKAEGRTAEQKNQAAVALALRNEAEVAIDLFEVTGEGSARYRRLIRLAEWAIDAKKYDRGQEFAWSAIASAKLKRDRRYALTLLVETYRRDKALGELVERFEKAESLDAESRSVWIDLLRELGKSDAAAALFEGNRSENFSAEMRRELLEMSRETGDDEALIKNYGRLIDREPRFIEWREGLARFFLERGDRERGVKVWDGYEEVAGNRRYLLAAAATASGLGLDDVAERLARRLAADYPEGRGSALLFLYEMHLERGRREEAEASLDELNRVAEAGSAIRKDLAEAYDRLGRNDRSVEVLETLRKALGERAGTDLEMKLALQLSTVDREDDALELWQTLWRRTTSVPRRRYVEDRMMTVASRLGKLARIAVNIERKLTRGEADDLEAGLLVRLYTRVNDPVSATEVIEEHMVKKKGMSLEVLAEKARIFMTCEDFYNYEKTIEEMIAADPEGRSDHLRQLAMSKLERGKRDEAREILTALKNEEASAVSDEFEAGVLAIAGMREEALVAYRRGLARHPERIDGYLLLSNTMKELGRFDRSAGMFQFLAATADKDDLFTIAIDGILNMRDGRRNAGAPDSLVKWARRVALERLARRPDKFYLYQLVADLSEEVNDRPMAVRALKAALPVAGERRTPLLRELMTMTKTRRGSRVSYRIVNGVLQEIRPKPKDLTQHLMFGRRLVGQGELVPPGVYLELGEAFLQKADVDNAMRTFKRANKLPEFQEMRRDVAQLLVRERFPKDALEVYRRILSVETEDIGILRRVANLEEQLGRDDEALQLYRRALDVYLRRKPPVLDVAKKKGPTDYFGRSVNQDASEGQVRAVADGLLAVLPSGDEGRRFLLDLESRVESALELVAKTEGELRLARFPRLEATSRYLRRAALAMGELEIADRIDAALIGALPDDQVLARAAVSARLGRGYAVSARSLVARAVTNEDLKRRLLLRAGGGGAADVPGLVPMGDAANLMLPALIDGRKEEMKLLLARLDLAAEDPAALSRMPVLIAASTYIGDEDMTLSLLRVWLDIVGRKEKVNLYGAVEVLLKHAKAHLSPKPRRDFVQHLVDAIVEKPGRFRNLTSQLPELEKAVGVRLLDDDQAEKLIRSRLESSDRFIYGIPQLFRLVTAETRESTLRGVWSSVPKGQRSMFVLLFLQSLEDPVSESFADFLVGSFENGWSDADDTNSFQYYVPDLVESAARNLGAAVRVMEIYAQKVGDKPEFVLRRQVAYAKLGRMEGTVAFAKKQLVSLYEKNSTDYQVMRSQGELRGLLVPHTDELLAHLDSMRKKDGDKPEYSRVHLRLLEIAERKDEYREYLARAVTLHPDEKEFRQTLERRLSASGRMIDVLTMQVDALAEKPEDKTLRARLEGTWKRLGNPVEALKVKNAAPKPKEGESADAEQPAGKQDAAVALSLVSGVSSSGGGAVISIPAMSLVSGSVSVAASGGKTDDEKDSRRAKVATPKLVKASVDKKDLAAARRDYRRLWRTYPAQDNARFGYFFGPSGISTSRRVWPRDEDKTKKDKAKAKAIKRVKLNLGGLPRNFLEDVKPPKKADPAEKEKNRRIYIHEALQDLDFASEEYARQLRLLTGSTLDGALARDVYRALASMQVNERGLKGALENLLAREAEGQAGKTDYGVLFELLERAKDEGGEDSGSVLERLLETVPASDTARLRRLARLFAREGRAETAELLYLWSAICPPVIDEPEEGAAPIFRSFGNRNFASEPLIREIEEVLEGERRLRVIGAVIAAEEPDPTSGWGRDRWMAFSIRTWARLLEPAAAVARTEALIEEILARRGETPPREAAREAALLLSRAGDYDRARSAFEVALASLEAPKNLTYRWYRDSWESNGYIDDVRLRKMFPLAGIEEEGAVDWPAAAAADVLRWLDDDRLDSSRAQRVLALLAVRLGRGGDLAGGRRVMKRLERMAGESPSQLLWVADVAREVGAVRRAREIELELFQKGALLNARIPGLMEEVLAEWGPRTLIRVALPTLDFTRDRAVVGTLIEAAEMVRNENLRDRLTKWEDEADTARREYRRIAEAARKKREAAKKKAEAEAAEEEEAP